MAKVQELTSTDQIMGFLDSVYEEEHEAIMELQSNGNKHGRMLEAALAVAKEAAAIEIYKKGFMAMARVMERAGRGEE